MLTKEAMIYGWSLLSDRFGNKASENILAIYFKDLRTKLTDEQWIIAVERTILEETFFPSAKTLIEKILVSPEEQIEDYWKVIIEAAKRGQRPELPPLANEALGRIGGRLAIEQCSESKLPWLKKEFSNLFKLLANNNQKQLPESNENAA